MSYKRKSWSFNQLDEIIPCLHKIENTLDKIESEQDDEVNPLPAMTTQECLDYFFIIINIAKKRVLTSKEAFISEQLIANYKMAVSAELLGKTGRYFVISEKDIEMINKSCL